MSVEQPSTKRSKKADAKANASGSTVSAAVDVNDHKHLNASLTLLRTQDDLIALAGLPLDHDLVIDNFKLCAIIRGIVAASEAGSMFDETEVSMRICGRSPRAVRAVAILAPVALEGRLCLSGKPHEVKRSLVWLNLPSLAKPGKTQGETATTTLQQ